MVTLDTAIDVLYATDARTLTLQGKWSVASDAARLKAASHDSQMLVTATYSQQMTEVIPSTSSFDQLN